VNLLESIEKLNKRVPLASVVTGFLGLAYITGYIISALFLRHRGIAPLPLLKAQYIETGLSFLLVTTILAGIPFLIFQMRHADKNATGRFRLISILIATIVTTNYLIIVALVVIFVESEWRASTTIFDLGIQFSAALVPYLLLTAVSLMIPRMLILNRERSEAANTSSVDGNWWKRIWQRFLQSRRLTGFVAFICRVAALVATIFMDIVIFKSFTWLPCFFSHIIMYISAILFFWMAIYVVWWFAKGAGGNELRIKIWCVGIPAFLLCYYMCVMTYSYRVYPNVPSSRGGKYPTSEYVIHIKASHTGSDSLIRPLYLLEETEDFFYGVSVEGCEWFYNDDPVWAVPKSEIEWIQLTKNEHPEPRSWMCSLTEPSLQKNSIDADGN